MFYNNFISHHYQFVLHVTIQLQCKFFLAIPLFVCKQNTKTKTASSINSYEQYVSPMSCY